MSASATITYAAQGQLRGQLQHYHEQMAWQVVDIDERNRIAQGEQLDPELIYRLWQKGAAIWGIQRWHATHGGLSPDNEVLLDWLHELSVYPTSWVARAIDRLSEYGGAHPVAQTLFIQWVLAQGPTELGAPEPPEALRMATQKQWTHPAIFLAVQDLGGTYWFRHIEMAKPEQSHKWDRIYLRALYRFSLGDAETLERLRPYLEEPPRSSPAQSLPGRDSEVEVDKAQRFLRKVHSQAR